MLLVIKSFGWHSTEPNQSCEVGEIVVIEKQFERAAVSPNKSRSKQKKKQQKSTQKWLRLIHCKIRPGIYRCTN